MKNTPPTTPPAPILPTTHHPSLYTPQPTHTPSPTPTLCMQLSHFYFYIGNVHFAKKYKGKFYQNIYQNAPNRTKDLDVSIEKQVDK